MVGIYLSYFCLFAGQTKTNSIHTRFTRILSQVGSQSTLLVAPSFLLHLWFSAQEFLEQTDQGDSWLEDETENG